MGLGEIIEGFLKPIITIFDNLINNGWGLYIILGIITFAIVVVLFT